MITESRSQIGGAAGESGALYRASVAAYFVAHGLRGRGPTWLQLSDNAAIPVGVRLETEHPVDDVLVDLTEEGRAFVQAKASLKLESSAGSEFGKALAQWKAAVRDGSVNAGCDRLVLAVGQASRPIRDLGAALSRRRDGLTGAAPSAQQSALERLNDHLGDLTHAQRELLLDVALVHHLQVADDGEADAAAAEAIMDPLLAGGGSRKAWRAIRLRCSELASKRAGLQMSDWIGWLEASGFQIVGDQSASAAAAFTAERQLERAYRRRVGAAGRRVDLRPLAPLSDASLVALGSEITVGTSEGSESTLDDRPIQDAIQRRGRVLVFGLPGAGKSTALRLAAAGYAEDEQLPIPIVVDLRHLDPALAPGAVLEAIVGSAVRDEPLDTQPALERLLVRQALEGRASFFLDGLDECGEHKQRIVRLVERLSTRIGPDCDLVMSVRDTAESAAAALPLQRLRLRPPKSAESLARAVLKAIRDSDGFAGDATLDERASWVKGVLDRDPQLGETPMLPIILAGVAATRSGSGLPSTRAAVLSAAVERTTELWELGQARPDPNLGPLSGQAEFRDVLLDVFEALGAQLVEGPAKRRTLEASLLPMLEDRWGLPSGRAGSVARTAVDFWREAGVLSIAAPDDVVECRLRLFGELAAARALARDDLPVAELEAELARTLADPDRVEVMVLGAGISSRVADAFTRAAINGGEAQRVEMARAVREGAMPSKDALTDLRDELVQGMRKHDELGETEQARTLGLALAYLPADGPERDVVLRSLREHLDSFAAKIACATAFGTWGERTERADAAYNSVLSESRRTAEPPLRRFGTLQIRFPWSALQEAVVLASTELLPKKPDVASLVAARSMECSMRVAGELRDLLVRNGHAAEVQSLLRDRFTWPGTDWDLDADWDRLLELIASLGPHADLSPTQARRLTELGDLIATLGFNDAAAVDVTQGLRQPELAELIDGIAALASFDKAIVASEARWAASEFREGRAAHVDVSLYVIDGAEDREVDNWDSVESPTELRHLCVRALGWESWLAHCAAEGLASSPPDDELISRLEGTLTSVAPARRRLVAAVLDHLDPDPDRRIAWACDDDSMLRRAGAEALSSALAFGELEVRPAVLELLNDADAGVVEHAIEGLSPDSVTTDLFNELERIAALEQQGWFCAHCLSTNPPGSGRSCVKCKVVGPEPAAAAERLIDEISSN